MKKILAGLLTTAVIASAVVGFTACNKPGGPKSTIDNTSSSSDLLGMAMTSASEYVATGAGVSAEKTPEQKMVDNIEEKIQLITEFVKTDNKPQSTIEDFTPDPANEVLKGYDHKFSFVKKDIYDLTKEDKYVFYYKEVKLPTDVDEAEEDGEFETEEEFKLEGKLELNGEYFDMVGERTIETETEEEDGETSTETESEFKAEVTFKDGSKMIFKQEVELEGNEKEEKFVYTIKDKDGNTLDSFLIEIENEDGENEIVYRDTKNKIMIELEEELKNNSNELELKYSENGQGVQKAIIKISRTGNEEIREYIINGGEPITVRKVIE